MRILTSLYFPAAYDIIREIPGTNDETLTGSWPLPPEVRAIQFSKYLLANQKGSSIMNRPFVLKEQNYGIAGSRRCEPV